MLGDINCWSSALWGIAAHITEIKEAPVPQDFNHTVQNAACQMRIHNANQSAAPELSNTEQHLHISNAGNAPNLL